MKKVISIFLLFIMLAVGAHVVLAMHFCAGELYSFGVLNNNDIKMSCCENMKIPQQEDNSCHTTQDPEGHSILPSHENCCDIRNVELSTDDYQHHIQQFNLSEILPSYHHVWLALYLLIPTESDDTAKNDNKYFPPGGLSLLNIDLLTYICIYRI